MKVLASCQIKTQKKQHISISADCSCLQEVCLVSSASRGPDWKLGASFVYATITGMWDSDGSGLTG